MTLIRDVLQLPEQVRKGDFVLVLAEGIRRAEDTVATYAITPSLVHAFDTALSVIHSALQDQRSQAAFLHGSFGSGKSHFMAVLELMLEGHPAPWQRAELHKLREKYPWVGEKKFLRLPLHMIGAQSVEQQVFQTYLAWVAENHPTAPVPALYGDQSLFDNAVHLRSNMGDDRFFEILNEGAPVASGWGSLQAQASWTAERFDHAATTTDMHAREELYSALVKTHFPAFQAQSAGYIELDKGLEVLTRHAAGLGYDGVVMLMDELILWLHSHLANREFVQNEALKLTKLKEAQHEKRAIPIVSFIARQRDLGDLVGQDVVGVEMASIRDSLAWSGGRFEQIPLEDRNLPAVVERRVVRAKDATAESAITDAFIKVKRTHQKSWSSLLGSIGDEPDFRKVYPFSPALVETLVALSSCLQRERTAIRILMELLVEHLRDLELGDVVPLGDIFDVIAGGEDAFDLAMKDRFERAKNLYQNHFLPVIQGKHGTGSRERCQRMRDDHPARLGCSGCKEGPCRNDNRVAKTLLLAALVPEAAVFKSLRASALVHLNPGAVRTMIPGQETGTVANNLRQWATQVGQLKVGDQSDPEVYLRLEGVDLSPILQSAQQADTLGQRKRLLKEILFKVLELPPEGTTATFTVTWRGTKRTGVVRFGNVRDMADSNFVCPPESAWHVLIDYPFDEPGFSPEHDLQRLEQFREQQTARHNLTFVWLPSFFSEKLERELGQLAIVEHVLTGDGPRQYLGHLRAEDQSRARLDLDSLRNQKRNLIRRALDQAYGIASDTKEGLLDPARTVEDHVVSLEPGLPGRPLLAAGFSEALQQLAERLLEHRYPHHPRFGTTVTVGKLDKMRALIERVIDAPDQRMPVSKQEHDDLLDLAAPLSLVELSESTVFVGQNRLREIDQKREQAGAQTPTIAQVRAYIDPADTWGLMPEASAAVAVIYSLWSGRTLERGGRPYQVDRLDKLPDDVELVKPDLPTEPEWHKALDSAAALFGIAIPGKALTARNLTAFAAKLTEAVGKYQAAEKVPSALEQRLSRWVQDHPDSARLITAHATAELIAGLRAGRAVDQVRFLAGFVPRTSGAAMAKSLNTSQAVLDRLSSHADWIVLESVGRLLDDPTRGNRAGAIMEELRSALVADELNQPFPAKVVDLVRRAGELINQTVHGGGDGGGSTTSWQRVYGDSKPFAPGKHEAALADVTASLKQTLDNPEGEYRVTIVVEKRSN